MKKKLSLFIVVISICFVALLSFTLISCNTTEEIAEAANLSLNSVDGVVKPNLFPYYDFSVCTVLGADDPAPTVLSDVGIYYTSGCYVGTSNTNGYTVSYLDLFVNNTVYFVLDTVPYSVNFFLSSSGTRSVTFDVLIVGSNLGSSTYTTASFGGSMRITRLGDFYSSGSSRILLAITNSSSYSVRYFNVKLEPVSPGATNLSSGFVIPGYSYPLSDDDPDPDPGDVILPNDGVVRPNLIKGSDFKNVPFYMDPDPTVPASTLYDMKERYWYSEFDMWNYISSYNDSKVSFSLPTGYSQRITFQNQIPASLVATSGDVTFTVLVHCNNDLKLRMVAYYRGTELISEIFSLDHTEMGYCSVTIDVTSIPVVSTYPLLIYFSLYDFDYTNGDSVVDLYYSKLEYGDSFTGYVYPNHDYSSAVRDTYIMDYDYKTAPKTVNTDVYLEDEWAITTGAVATLLPDHGITVAGDTSLNSKRYNVTYGFSDYFLNEFGRNLNQEYTLTLQAKASVVGAQVVILGEDANNMGVLQWLYSFYIPSSLYTQDYSWTFLMPDNLHIMIESLHADSVPSIDLYYSKLEKGANFTGFVPNYDDVVASIYDDGYSNGYMDGVEVYANTTIELDFNNVESPDSINQGWADWGFDSASSFNEIFIQSCTCGFYLANDYKVGTLLYKPLLDSSNQVIGMEVFASRDIGVDITTAINYFSLLIQEHYTRLYLVDSEYPSSWNPVAYPNYRTVYLVYSRGLEDVLEQYKEQATNAGDIAGYNRGYNEGLLQGKIQGYDLASEVVDTGGWFGFFSAFIDVPVRVIMSLLDFDFFGFNLFNFVKVIVLLSLVFLFMRLITKGKVSS